MPDSPPRIPKTIFTSVSAFTNHQKRINYPLIPSTSHTLIRVPRGSSHCFLIPFKFFLHYHGLLLLPHVPTCCPQSYPRSSIKGPAATEGVVDYVSLQRLGLPFFLLFCNPVPCLIPLSLGLAGLLQVQTFDLFIPEISKANQSSPGLCWSFPFLLPHGSLSFEERRR